MNIDPSLWSKLHGAATHFPIALMLVSTLCDSASLVPGDPERQRGFRFAGTVTLTIGALGSYAAVASGLVMARGHVWGHGALLWHHIFVWPAFALMFLAAALMSGAGDWGGELLNRLTP